MRSRALRLGLSALLAAAVARADLVTLKSGEILEGKARQWGERVLFWDRYGEAHDFHRSEVQRVEYKRRAEELAKPNLPDLTVRYIERLPRDPGFHGGFVQYDLPGKQDLGVLKPEASKYQLHRKPGEKVTFIVHIFNAGPAPAGAFGYRISIGDKPVAAATLPGLKPAEEKRVEVPWAWQAGQHEIKVELDPEGKLKEITRANNTFADPIRALTFFFAVHKTTYDAFSQVLNVVDSFNFEDWAQYHVHMMNFLFAESRWLSAPNGIAERVRVDKIIVVPECDEALYVKDQRRNGDPKEVIEYNGNWSFGKSELDNTRRWALNVDWGLPHELGHQLGLVDIYQLNVDPWQILARRMDGTYATLKHFYPAPATMMHWHGPHIFSEFCAGYLNQTLGRPRGYFGDYYYDIPDKCLLKVLSISGKPVPNAKVELFQRSAFKPPHHFVHGEPVSQGQTDENGVWLMPNRPAPHHKTLSGPDFKGYEMKDNPWGHIHVVGFNAMMLARVEAAGREEFFWLRLCDFNVAKWRGAEKEYTHPLKTRFPDAGAPEPPQKPTVGYHMPIERKMAELWWDRSPSPDIVRYNVYQKVGDGDEEVEPFRLVAIVDPARFQPKQRIGHGGLKYHEKFEEHGFYTLDTYFAVAAVTADGRESGLSETVHVPWIGEGRRAAVLPDGRVIFSADRHPSLYWSPGNGGVREFGIRTTEFPVDPYGLCADGDGNLVVTDAHNNQVLVFDPKGTLLRRLSKQAPRRESKSAKPGEFDYPCDVATDAQGNLYVAERDNHRVQVLDKAGKPLYTLGGDKGRGEKSFDRPTAVSVCSDRLLVSDEGNRRVVIYWIKNVAQPPAAVGAEPFVFDREITDLRAPDRALMTAKENVYVCDPGDNTLKVFDRGGKLIHKHEALEAAFEPGHVKLDGPRGLCTSDGRTAYLVTRFPVRTLKVRLD